VENVKRCRFGLFWLLLAVIPSLFAQETPEEKAKLTIKLDQILSEDFPNLTIYAVVENDKQEVVTGLSPGLFEFRIDSMEVNAKSTITPFSMNEEPIDYSIIFSNNGIMEGEPLDSQKTAILQFIDAMKKDDLLSLYTIGEETGVVFEEQTKDAIDPSAVNSVEVTAVQPRLYDSLITVMRKVERRKLVRRVVIVISDGRDQNSRFTKNQLDTVLAEVGVPVYAIGIRVLDSQSLSNLNEMADLTSGTYVFTQLRALPDALKSMTARITQPYIIKARIRGMKADNQPHVFEVAVNERDSAGKGQKTFTAVIVPVPRWVKWAVLIAAVVILAVLVLVVIILRIRKRRAMGITKRRCPECKNLMKDTWDSCPFCRYMPKKKKKKKET
jgi:hypothetical protein